MERIAYDEFGLFHENASEYGIALGGAPSVRRTEVEVAPGRTVSALVWGTSSPRIVFIHGGAQNAHTWDTVILALGPAVSALAVDLPGHGHSGWRDDGAYTPQNLADDVAIAIGELAPQAAAVVGMSLGGMTSMQLAVRHPQLVRKLMLVDITPGVNQQKAKAVLDFVNGPQSFPSFESLLERTMEHNPTRAESSLRRGILHNAHQLDDGSWQWNYDRSSHARSRDAEAETPDGAAVGADGPTMAPTVPPTVVPTPAAVSPMWDDFARIACPLMLVRGGISPVVDDDDVAEARRRRPEIAVEVVDGAGHSIQGDRPLELAALVRTFVPLP
ncbi:MAG: putative hydrolase [Ilumatobacteraceae bacterium]|nr:putative hydrolase [Ilumatobacteraceae bacterium]